MAAMSKSWLIDLAQFLPDKIWEGDVDGVRVGRRVPGVDLDADLDWMDLRQRINQFWINVSKLVREREDPPAVPEHSLLN